VTIEQQIPRNALAWIIISLFALILPHAGRIPVWVLGVYVFAAIWRMQVHRGRWSFPGRWVKALLILCGFSGIYMSYGSLIGLEPTVALLLTAFALKLIELVRRKDAFVLLFLGYFVCATEFLFTQDLLVVAYSMLTVTLVTTALVALHRPGEHQFKGNTIRLAAVMLMQALPLMLVLFFLFPRIGPLWTVPLKSHSAKTGVSDFMKPGDISKLSQSDEVAFRVEFDGDIPPRSELYWRGLVFSKLEGGAWMSLPYYNIPVAERRVKPVVTETEPLAYTVIMAPSQQNWLYGLRYARPASPGVMETSDFRLYSPVQLEEDTLYQARSWPDAQLEETLSEWRRLTELQLPERQNPQTLQLARDLRRGVQDNRAFIDAVLARFNTQPYVYTLEPPALDEEDAMDEFLFETRRGFCEHYAYAFVIMMRAAGVPARVVAGYQGGEVNPVNKTVIVHQFDAHAWAEVWLEGEGWVRVDPTAAVSPDRIEWGLEEAVAQEGSFLANSPLSPLHFRSVVWLNMLRLRYDALTYRWQAWVVGFDSDRQFRLLQDVFGQLSAQKFATVLIGAWALVLIPVAISLLLRRSTRKTRPIDRYYRRFCQRMAKLGLEREPGETPRAFAARVQEAAPRLGTQVYNICGLYNELAYSRGPQTRGRPDPRQRQLKRAVRSFRPRKLR